jgi:hypothetical protein
MKRGHPCVRVSDKAASREMVTLPNAVRRTVQPEDEGPSPTPNGYSPSKSRIPKSQSTQIVLDVAAEQGDRKYAGKGAWGLSLRRNGLSFPSVSQEVGRCEARDGGCAGARTFLNALRARSLGDGAHVRMTKGPIPQRVQGLQVLSLGEPLRVTLGAGSYNEWNLPNEFLPPIQSPNGHAPFSPHN